MTGKDFQRGLNWDLRNVLDHAQSAAEDSKNAKADKGYKFPKEDREKIKVQIIKTEKFLRVVKRNTGIK